MLEESRAEHHHLTRRPTDRRFLRRAVHTLVIGDITSQTPTDPWHAALAAGLILARKDAGILDEDETLTLHHTITAILGDDLMNTLTAIWMAAHATADDDTPAMLQHAKAWCQALSADPTGREPAPDPAGRRGELAEAIGKVVAAVEGNEAAQEAAQARAEAACAARTRAQAAQVAHTRQAADMAEKVFAPKARPFTPENQRHTGRRATSPVTGTRAPTPAEKAAAGKLARALRAAVYREPTRTVTSSAIPPGRLNMRGALARDAQKAAGALPTAQPWTAPSIATAPPHPCV